MGTLRGRTLAVVANLSVEEQMYLYEKTRIFKEKWNEGEDLTEFRIEDPNMNIYLMFLENSTRTKESFRNAAQFHNVNLNIFDVESSSFLKSESILDTVKMLSGYSRRSVFIMRTKMEGVCRALEEQLQDYAQKSGREKPIFINGGDGRHEHPTQEFLDEFTFLEHHNWDKSHLHIALIGDLLHGRTVHSKADGLKIFDSVRVDLVAPEELALPESYKNRMRDNGFEVKEWSSIEEYLSHGEISDCWYFTRLQIERMGDEIREKEDYLRQSITFQKDWIEKLPKTTRFYHPLPRHKEKPVIPPFLDKTTLNGWDAQSVNGYFTRVIELAIVAGELGNDFEGVGIPPEEQEEEFIIPVEGNILFDEKKDRFKVGIKPVEQGTVIDHIARGKTTREIWDHIDKIRRILNLNAEGSHGVFHTSNPQIYKGIISLPNKLKIEDSELRKLAAVSPNCTLNVIKDKVVQEKYRLNIPPKIYNFTEISCKNPDCVTAPGAWQHVPPSFYRSENNTFTCLYCGKCHEYGKIWDI